MSHILTKHDGHHDHESDQGREATQEITNEAINVLAHESIQTPSVAWTGLLPIIILAAAGIPFLTICSLFPRR
ncbi:MAG: hypothetical protein Ct9H90mP11_01380 [Acidimicrobiales bacterium]|nr:MAG: hypothetical protein Ct9H90mP11_01380 [Acidimicrobiales bacterium]